MFVSDADPTTVPIMKTYIELWLHKTGQDSSTICVRTFAWLMPTSSQLVKISLPGNTMLGPTTLHLMVR